MVSSDPRVGTVLHDRYRVLERLTAGSMGVVYRAERVGLAKPVAVKVLHESYAATEDGMRRFEVEARAMSRLSHPNCVSVIDFGVDDDGAPYLVMDFLTGRTLRLLLQQEGRLVARRAVAIVRQVVAGLDHAHGHGIVHRDVKPENIVVTAVEGHGDHVRILDFGLAKLRDQKTVTSGVALGTPSYMAPEQTVGLPVDERADVYAVGIILYELLTGWKPFTAASPLDVMRMHREVEPAPIAAAIPDARPSPELEAIVLRALAKSADERFPSMAELAQAIEATPEARYSHSRPMRRGLAALAVASMFAAAAVVWSSGNTPAPAAGDGEHAAVAPQPAAERLPPEPPDPNDGADVQALLSRAAAGERDAVIAELEALRVRQPRRAPVYYALGTLYTEAQSWQLAVEAYAAALTLESAYRDDDRLIADAVQALADERAHERAARLIEQQLGDAALSRLEEATRSANPALRERAEQLRARLAQR